MNYKKGITPLFLAALICVFSCYYIPFFFHQKEIRKEIKNAIKKGINDEELVKFTFSANELEKLMVDGENEFIYNSNPYDIVKTETVSGKIAVYALADKKEKEIFKNLDELVSNYLGNDKGTNSPMKALGKLVSLKFLTVKKATENTLISLSIEKNYLLALLLNPQGGHPDAPFTPPELI
ncbi:MAG: hypothetical protein IAF38_18510 [Bacteroidia bacterium]|nr:hypothetical protein [Bacteroidia bacterium]